MIVKISICLVFTFLFFPAASVSGDIIDLVYEFDGNSDGMTSFGTIELTQNVLAVEFDIIANTANLVGGDIHEFYFNLPDSIDISSLAISNSGGGPNQSVDFTSLGEDPNIAGGAGSSFDTGISFGNGGGPPGNGELTTATFSLTADGGLLVSDFFSETSSSNNAPPLFVAVHFQSTMAFDNADSETVGGGTSQQGPAVPEPASMTLLGLAGLQLLRIRSRKPNFC